MISRILIGLSWFRFCLMHRPAESALHQKNLIRHPRSTLPCWKERNVWKHKRCEKKMVQRERFWVNTVHDHESKLVNCEVCCSSLILMTNFELSGAKQPKSSNILGIHTQPSNYSSCGTGPPTTNHRLDWITGLLGSFPSAGTQIRSVKDMIKNSMSKEGWTTMGCKIS